MLKHDGILILDQRNYDAMLDDGFSSKHTYYYCGEDVIGRAGVSSTRDCAACGTASLTNPSTTSTCSRCGRTTPGRLMSEVGFQRIETYGDFQHTYRGEQPDFFVHVAEKEYRMEDEREGAYSAAVSTARTYYNSADADAFYATRVGRRGHPHRPLRERRGAHRRRQPPHGRADVAKLDLTSDSVVLDLGCGLRRLGALPGRDVRLPRHRTQPQRGGERAPPGDERPARTHRQDRGRGRFLREHPVPDDRASTSSGPRTPSCTAATGPGPGGDRAGAASPAASSSSPTRWRRRTAAPPHVLQPILDRIHLDDMGSPGFYRRELTRLGFTAASQRRLRGAPRAAGQPLRAGPGGDRAPGGRRAGRKISHDYLAQMKKGLGHWVDGGNEQSTHLGNLPLQAMRNDFAAP